MILSGIDLWTIERNRALKESRLTTAQRGGESRRRGGGGAGPSVEQYHVFIT